MNPERWRRLQKLFDDAVDLESAVRSSYLDEACADDPDLRAQVESLVLHDQAVTIDSRAGFGGLAAAPDPDRLLGTRVGPYRLERLVGSGGMGAVYLASRADEEFRLKVAVKLMRAGFPTPEMVSRFRIERQILARLEHPNLARLIDGGTTMAGLPYLVMEYVPGVTITSFCDGRRLAVADRLRLFRSVCAVVQYTHQHLVVHRDIKPSNLIVTDDGVPKLLDFGIAKLLVRDEDEALEVVTHTHTRIMTPEYASPEQVRGGPVTTASDIYSLGALLYELLAGRPPFRVQGASLAEIEKLVGEVVPLRPSVVGGPRRPGVVEVDRDLDTIVMKALQKDPVRRYGSAEQFGDDLRRYLDGHPVRARSDSVVYRTRKFVRRHRVAVAASVAFVVGFGVLAGSVARLAAGLREERNQAWRDAEAAREVSAYLGGLLAVGGREPPAVPLTTREALDHGARRLEAEYQDRPESRARLLAALARSYRGLGVEARARDLAAASLEIRERALGPDDLETLESAFILGDALRSMGATEEAVVHLRRALEGRRARLGRHSAVAEALHALGLAFEDAGEPSAARAALQEALDLRRELIGEDDPLVAETAGHLARLRDQP